ncbi:hypothetical protein DYB32_003920 [Aphanomyces invadans]|uniref:Major facilitator superfamily (MFS) profile domain-containing protein n=1 Tax=Aphanomyces invadans TaxID=157072 RepID=A0A3R6VN59_9STRA|nr:hypothetical protein DYB32_003920 [Aphanomyces invadans]
MSMALAAVSSTASIFVLFCVINVLNYVDRGIIPGAPTQFQYFIKDTLHTSMTEEGFYLGVLASAFITSYAVFIVLFGYLSITMRPFRLIGIGLIIWCAALVLCGLAQHAKSFSLLLFGRVLSGIGESSFQCISPAFIDDHAPASTRTLWIGIFFTGTSVGTAIGYGYGAFFAHSSLGWSTAFYLASFLIIAFTLVEGHALCFVGKPSAIKDSVDETSHLITPEACSKAMQPPSIVQEAVDVLTQPIFILTVLGSAAFTFTIAGLGVFGPLFLLGLGLFQSETEASMMFGSLVVVSAMVGTPLGGYILDRYSVNEAPSRRQYLALVVMTILMAGGVMLCLLAWAVLPAKGPFLVLITLSLIFLFATPSCTAVAVLLCVPSSRRNFAVGISTLLVHVFGDVPSPLLLGMLKDIYAPHCGSVEVDGQIGLNPDCRCAEASRVVVHGGVICSQDQAGLRLTFLVPMLWLLWTVLTWSAAILVARFRLPRRN